MPRCRTVGQGGVCRNPAQNRLDLSQLGQDLVGLHKLDNSENSHYVADAIDCSHHCCINLVLHRIPDEASINFKKIDVQILKVCTRRHPGAKVIEQDKDMTPNSLPAFIRAALAQALRSQRIEPTLEQLAEDAHDALGCVQVAMNAISEVDHPAPTERTFIGLVLLRASCDNARAILFLLSNNPVDMAASALALHRAQIETFLRAVFFSRLATDDQFQDFVDNDKGPRQRTANGKWANISVPKLAELVQAQLEEMEEAEPGTHRLARTVANAWDHFAGWSMAGARSTPCISIGNGRSAARCRPKFNIRPRPIRLLWSTWPWLPRAPSPDGGRTTTIRR